MPPLDYKVDQSKTPEKWKGPPDARGVEDAGTYPNQRVERTRSGHTLILDDSDGAESVTLQHRSGSMVQFLPDGAVQFVSHNGQYNFVFGENRVQITGAYDVTVQGGGSLRVEGDYNTTVMGNHNTTVNGDMNITAKNMNTVVRGNMDTSAQNMTTKIAGSTEITTEGVTNITSDGGMSLSSTSAPVSILGQGDLGIGTSGTMFLHAGGDLHMKTEGAGHLQATGKLSLKGSDSVAVDGKPFVLLNSGASDPADIMDIAMPIPVNPNREA